MNSPKDCSHAGPLYIAFVNDNIIEDTPCERDCKVHENEQP